MTINYQYSNMLNAGSFGLNVLSPDDIELIHMSTLDVLWNIGLKVMSPNARVIFGDSGCGRCDSFNTGNLSRPCDQS